MKVSFAVIILNHIDHDGFTLHCLDVIISRHGWNYTVQIFTGQDANYERDTHKEKYFKGFGMRIWRHALNLSFLYD
jgi:hypothetical protein